MSEVIQQQMQSMEDQIQVAEKGYQLFRRMYAQTNRMPEKRAYVSRLGILRAALMIIMVAGSIVSASHTIPTFANTEGKQLWEINGILIIVGIAAFFMSEVALAAFAYVGVMRHYRETQQEPKSLKTLVGAGVGVPFIVMAAANISHEFSINKVDLPDFIKTGIVLAISLSAPFMSYIAGEVFAMFEVIDRVDQEKHEALYADLLEKWEEKCRAAWGREKSNYGGRVRIDPVPVPVLSAPFADVREQRTDGEHGYGQGYTKTSDAREQVRAYFVANPEDLKLSVRAAADKMGRKPTVVGEVMKEMRS